jgi:hypothetical protein
MREHSLNDSFTGHHLKMWKESRITVVTRNSQNTESKDRRHLKEVSWND